MFYLIMLYSKLIYSYFKGILCYKLIVYSLGLNCNIIVFVLFNLSNVEMQVNKDHSPAEKTKEVQVDVLEGSIFKGFLC